MNGLSIAVEPIELPLVHIFKIARGEEAVARTVILRVRAGERCGIGEATPIGRYGETIESVAAYFAAHPPTGSDPYRLQTLLGPKIPAAARAGFDLALHDLIGRELGKPLYALLGIDPSRMPLTSFTIGIADPQETLRKVEEARDFPILKVKLGGGTPSQEVETIAAVRAIYGGALRIDANEAWSVDDAIRILRELQRYGIQFCEQPVPAGHPHWLRAIRERVAIPIVADEDCLVASDLPPLAGCIDGVNVKLAKAGGIRGALDVIATARAMGLRVMIGCMVESGIAATAAAHLAPLADWADLDGPLLVAADPFPGVTYCGGTMTLPQAPGIGVREAAPA